MNTITIEPMAVFENARALECANAYAEAQPDMHGCALGEVWDDAECRLPPWGNIRVSNIMPAQVSARLARAAGIACTVRPVYSVRLPLMLAGFELLADQARDFVAFSTGAVYCLRVQDAALAVALAGIAVPASVQDEPLETRKNYLAGRLKQVLW